MSNHPPPNPTFSSSLLNHIFLSIDRDPQPSDDSPNLARFLVEDRKTSSLRRSRLVEKWMDKPIIPPPPPPRRRPSPPPPPPPLPTPDDDPDSFFSTTSVSSSDSGLSSTPSDPETPPFDPSSKPKTSCFGPFRAPKPVKTKPKPTNSDQFEENCPTNKSSSSSSSSSRAVKIYSQLKSLKQPISPGIKLAKYINSLFIKETLPSKNKTNNNNTKESDSFQGRNRKSRAIPVQERMYKSEQTSPEWSFSSSSFSSKKVNNEIVGKSATKRDEEARKVKMGEVEGIDEADVNRKVLEEVALDLLNSYWNRRKSGNGDGDDKGDDDSSCSSSDLFEIDHLSLIANDELPVYETTHLITN